MNLPAEAAASTECQGDLLILFLGEDWNARRLKDGDLHQRAVRLHRLPVIIGYHKQLQKDTAQQYNNRNASTEQNYFFSHHHTAHYTNNFFFQVTRHFFVDMFSILIKTDWQNRIWQRACKAPREWAWMYWSTFIDCGEWGLGEAGRSGAAQKE